VSNIVGYARVSMIEQNADLQLDALSAAGAVRLPLGQRRQLLRGGSPRPRPGRPPSGRSWPRRCATWTLGTRWWCGGSIGWAGR